MNNIIEFVCWKNDEPIEIQLEPEAFSFKVLPGESLKFEALDSSDDFHWSLRISFEEKGIQLFPGNRSFYNQINIYKNNSLQEDWTALYSS